MTLLPENCSYSEFFWSVFSRIRSENRPEKLRIRTFFTQCPPLTDLKISGGGDFTTIILEKALAYSTQAIEK